MKNTRCMPMFNPHLDQQVASILSWREGALAEFKYQQGIAFLMWYLPCNEQSRNTLERSKLYWNWWKYCWQIRDEAFVVNGIENIDHHHRQSIYIELHNARLLMIEGLRPGEVVTKVLFNKPDFNKKEVLV
jgi:hypothetical protein